MKLHQCLDLEVGNKMDWSKKEIIEFKKQFPFNSNKNLSKIFNRTISSIRQRAYKLRLRKNSSWMKKQSSKSHLGIASHRKGLSIEQEYGVEKAKVLREKLCNAQRGHTGWTLGRKNSKISKALKGRVFTKEHRKKLSNKRKEMYKEGKLPEFIDGEREKNLTWNGGTSFGNYSKTFNNRFKRLIRKRDNQVCMLCGIHREKLYKTLFVHHIDYNKLSTIPKNCISLCNSCHTKTNTNRKHWTNFFQNLLTERYGYNYSEDIVVDIVPLNNYNGGTKLNGKRIIYN